MAFGTMPMFFTMHPAMTAATEGNHIPAGDFSPGNFTPSVSIAQMMHRLGFVQGIENTAVAAETTGARGDGMPIPLIAVFKGFLTRDGHGQKKLSERSGGLNS